MQINVQTLLRKGNEQTSYDFFFKHLPGDKITVEICSDSFLFCLFASLIPPGGQGKGLGGSFSLDTSSAASNLLRTRFMPPNAGGGMMDRSQSSFLGGGNFGSKNASSAAASCKRQLPTYNLQVSGTQEVFPSH